MRQRRSLRRWSCGIGFLTRSLSLSKARATDRRAALTLWGSEGALEVRQLLTANDGAAMTMALASSGGASYFTAASPETGLELWRTVGTPSSTVLVKNIAYGTASSHPEDLTIAGGRVFFTADDGFHGRELWVSDGTESGTRLVADLGPGRISGGVSRLTAVGDLVYFTRQDEEHGRELWVSDGTEAGTRLAADIVPGFPGSNPRELTILGSTLYFVAGAGNELWRSEGGPNGASLVLDLGSGATITNLAATRDKLIFRVTDLKESAIWSSDGTSAGSSAIFGIGQPASLIVGANRAFFLTTPMGPSGMRDLWTTDGSPSGNQRLGQVPVLSELIEEIGRLTVVGDALYFTVPVGDRSELWEADATTGVLRTAASTIEGGFPALGAVGGSLFYASGTAMGETALFRIARPGQGPHRVLGLGAANDTQVLTTIVDDDGRAVFLTRSVVGNFLKFWSSDGESATVLKEFDLNAAPSSSPQQITRAGERAFFTAYQPATGVEIWTTDGRESRLARDIRPGSAGSNPSLLTAVGNRLYFLADDGAHGRELWKSDGTASGTMMVADLTAGPNGSAIRHLVSAGGRLYFTLENAQHGNELWVSDGTVFGTRMVLDIRQGPRGSNPNSLTAVGDVVYFLADDGVHGQELWASAGTPETTRLVRDLIPGPSGATFGEMVPQGQQLYFTADDGVHGEELWTSDGTLGGTILIADLMTGPQGSNPMSLTPFQGQIYFVADNGVHGMELWGSGDAIMGLGPRFDLIPGPVGSHPIQLTVAGPTLYFVADGPANGQPGSMAPGMYAVDGAPGNLTALPLGDASATSVSDMIGLGDQLVFVVDNSAFGEELWLSDGSPEGTGIWTDLHPGYHGSNPSGLTPINETDLVLTADDGLHGQEPWAVTLGAGPPVFLGDLNSESNPEPPDYTVLPLGPDPDDNENLVVNSGQGSQLVLVDGIQPAPLEEGDELTVGVSTSDLGLPVGSLLYGLGPGAPEGVVINPLTGIIHWLIEVAGDYLVPVRVALASDPTIQAMKTYQVSVKDVAPTVSVDGGDIVAGASGFTKTGRFRDPGRGPWTAWVNYGDGGGDQPLALRPDGSFQLQHRYATSGTREIVVKVADSRGGVGQSRFQVTALVPPRIERVALNDAVNLRFTVVINSVAQGPNQAFRLRDSRGRIVPIQVRSAIADGKTTAIISVARDSRTGKLPKLTKGRYVLEIVGSQITDSQGLSLDADDDGSAGGTRTVSVFRQGPPQRPRPLKTQR